MSKLIDRSVYRVGGGGGGGEGGGLNRGMYVNSPIRYYMYYLAPESVDPQKNCSNPNPQII